MNFGQKRLGSTSFYGGLYWGFCRESRNPHAVLITKEPDTFRHKAAWLSYFLRVIVEWIQLRVESFPRSF